MKTITYNQIGNPADVLTVKDSPSRAPGAGEVRVKVLSAPIHNADVLQIMGQYGRSPNLPATPGSEAVGRVVEIGEGVTHLNKDALVFISTGATWTQEVTGPATAFIAIPEGDVDQLAMLISSPATAHLMLTNYGELNEGDWIIQTAANSAVGSAVVQLAKAQGLRTVNIVRRQEVVDDLKELGADVVIVGTDNLAEQIAEATDGATIKLGFDAIGGPGIKMLVEALGMGGTIVSYSQVVDGPATIKPADLIFKQITIAGFWLAQWFVEASDEDKQALFGHLVPLVASGQLTLAVDSTFSLDQIKEAVTHSMKGRRKGKVMLHPNT